MRRITNFFSRSGEASAPLPKDEGKNPKVKEVLQNALGDQGKGFEPKALKHADVGVVALNNRSPLRDESEVLIKAIPESTRKRAVLQEEVQQSFLSEKFMSPDAVASDPNHLLAYDFDGLKSHAKALGERVGNDPDWARNIGDIAGDDERFARDLDAVVIDCIRGGFATLAFQGTIYQEVAAGLVSLHTEDKMPLDELVKGLGNLLGNLIHEGLKGSDPEVATGLVMLMMTQNIMGNPLWAKVAEGQDFSAYEAGCFRLDAAALKEGNVLPAEIRKDENGGLVLVKRSVYTLNSDKHEALYESYQSEKGGLAEKLAKATPEEGEIYSREFTKRMMRPEKELPQQIEVDVAIDLQDPTNSICRVRICDPAGRSNLPNIAEKVDNKASKRK